MMHIGYPCPICKKQRTYLSAQGAKKSEGRNCRSCSNSVQRGGQGMAFNEEGEKLCNDCRKRPQRHNSLCSECSVERRKKYYREVMRYKRYGITEEWFDRRFTGRCEICKDEVDRHTCHIDHDHCTGQVRGILCDLCNKGLGQFRDNPHFLQSAIKYLEENS